MPPYPYSWTIFHNEKIFITQVGLPQGSENLLSGKPGTISSVSPEGVTVRCLEGGVRIKEVMKETGEKLAAQKVFSEENINLADKCQKN